jgi:hypothetical protein
MWLQEIGLCAQDMVTILGPEVNMIGGAYMTTSLMNMGVFTSIMNEIFIWAQTIMRQMVMGMI